MCLANNGCNLGKNRFKKTRLEKYLKTKQIMEGIDNGKNIQTWKN